MIRATAAQGKNSKSVMGSEKEKTEKTVAKIRQLAVALEGDDIKRREEAAYQISSVLIALEHEIGQLSETLLTIEHLALDLEIPKKHIESYEIKVENLIEKIKRL